MTPNGWLQTTLEQVAEVEIGRTPARNQKSYWDPAKTTMNRWATIADIKHKFIGETFEHISDVGVQHSNSRLVPPGTLLMSFKLSLGRVAITETPMYTNEALAAFYPTGRTTTEYLYYLLPNLALEESSDRAVKGRTLNKAKLRTLKLTLPSINEQREITAILSSVDDAIEKTQTVIDQVQIVKRGLMQELLTRGVPGRHKRFKLTEIGKIPESWKVMYVGEIAARCDYGTSDALKSNGKGVPVLRMGNLQDGQVRMDGLKYLPAEGLPNELVLDRGDVLFNRTNSAKLVGKVAVFDHEIMASFASYLLRLRVHSQVGSGYWLSYLLNTEAYQKRLRATATPGVSQVNINRRSLLAIKVPLPSTVEQASIVAILDSIANRANVEQFHVKHLAEVKSALMSVLLTGEIRVTPDIEAA